MGGPGLSVGPPAMKKIRQDSIPTIKRTLVDLTGNAASLETKKTITPITANSAVRKGKEIENESYQPLLSWLLNISVKKVKKHQPQLLNSTKDRLK